MTPGFLSQIFSWTAIACSVLAAVSGALALHYRTTAGKQQAAEINRLKPRSLRDDQLNKLLVQLSQRQGTVGFIYRLMDGEGKDYSEALGKVFVKAGWRVASSAGNSLNDFPGYIVPAVSDEKLLPDLDFVRKALLAADIDCRLEPIQPNTLGGPLTADRVWLVVGRKP